MDGQSELGAENVLAESHSGFMVERRTAIRVAWFWDRFLAKRSIARDRSVASLAPLSTLRDGVVRFEVFGLQTDESGR